MKSQSVTSLATSLMTVSGTFSSCVRTSLTLQILEGLSGNGWTTFDVMISQTYVYCKPGESDADCLGPINGSNSSAVLNVSSTYPFGLLIHEVIGCVQRVEPWILEVQNSTRVAVATGVFSKGSSVHDAENQGGQMISMRNRMNHSIPEMFSNNLNSTNKTGVYREMYNHSSSTWILVSCWLFECKTAVEYLDCTRTQARL
jgi:hypothetical protein